MSPDVRPSTPPPSPVHPATAKRTGSAKSTSPTSPALAELSAASQRFTTNTHKPRPHPRINPLVAVLAGIVVGLALFVARPFSYRCGAMIEITGAEEEDVPGLRQAVLDFAWSHDTDKATPRHSPGRWFVESPAANRILLSLHTPNRDEGAARVQRMAEQFIAHFASDLKTIRDTPTLGERLLNDQAEALDSRLSSVEQQANRVHLAPNEESPIQTRDRLHDLWQQSYAEFQGVQQEVTAATEHLQTLRSRPTPTHGVVETAERNRALQANETVQQDLAEATVHLAELKLQLLTVWQTSSPTLDRLIGAIDGLSAVASTPLDDSDDAKPTSTDRSMTALRASVQEYAATVASFVKQWNGEFLPLRQREIDPMSGGLLETHERIRTHVNQFLFESGRQLAALRAQVAAFSAALPDQARHYVYQSNLTRHFQDMQSAHHKFEFQVGDLEPRSNYKLDIALRAAHGLQRRSRKRIASIDAKLQQRALAREKRLFAKETSQAEQRLQQAHHEYERVVSDLVERQKQLNGYLTPGDDFLRHKISSESAMAQATSLRQDLGRTQENMRSLQNRRLANAETRLRVAGDAVIVGPTDVPQRIQTAGLAALLTVLAVGIGQWWLTRRL